MNKISRLILSRKFILALTFLINVAFFALSIVFINSYMYWCISVGVLIIMAFFINAHNDNPEMKIIWILTMIVLPFFGIALYVYSKNSPGTSSERKRFLKISYRSSQLLMENREIKNSFESSESRFKKIGRYLYSSALMPVNTNTEVKYLASGNTYVNEVLASMENARKYIFLEFNNVEEGKVWNEFFEVMREKARLGVEVILLYDDKTCAKGFKDKRTFIKLANHQIKAVPFNRLNYFVPSSRYTDNRSLVVVDGNVGYLGSVNISDKSVNLKEDSVSQKDNGVKLTGDAVWNMAILFLNHYQFATKTAVELTKYKENSRSSKVKGFVQPFGSSPLIGANKIARDTYTQMINFAEKTLYITSPYIILDEEMKRTLRVASQSGVDVRIVVPSSGNRKKRNISQTYYSELIKAGVKVYEYDDGLINSRLVIADDNCAMVGTIPFDFRPTFTNAEDGVILYGKEFVVSVLDDFNEILTRSKLITLRDLKKRRGGQKISGQISRFFAPLF